MKSLHTLKISILYTLLTLVISLALISLAVRFLFATIDSYRNEIEKVVGNALNQPVKIEAIDARFIGLKPSLVLNKITLLERDDNLPIAHFKQLAIVVDSLTSISQRQLILDHFQITGADLLIERNDDSEISMGGVGGNTNATKDTQGDEDIAGWLLSHPNLVIKDSQVTILDHKTDHIFGFTNVDLRLHNNGDKHQLNGEVVLPKHLGNKIEFITTFNGNPTKDKLWGGELYFKSDGVSLHTLKPAKLTDDITLKGGAITSELWGKIEQGKLRDLEGTLSLKRFQLKGKQYQAFLPDMNGTVHFNKRGGLNELFIDDVVYEDSQNDGLPHSLHLVFDDGKGDATIDQLDIALAATYLKVEPELAKLLNGKEFSGSVSDISINWQAESKYKVLANLNDISAELGKKLPSIKNISGKVHWENNLLGILIDSKNVRLKTGDTVNSTYYADRLNGVVYAQLENSDWFIWSDKLHLTNSDLTLDLGLYAQLLKEQPLYLSLYSDLNYRDLTTLKRYLTADIIGKNTSSWLASAVKKGEISSGTVLFQGDVGQYPFKSQSGLIKVDLDTKDLDLKFSRDWPQMNNIDARIVYAGNSIKADISNARLYESRFSNIDFSIDNLNKPFATVSGTGTIPGKDIIRIFNESPLKENINNVTAQMRGGGSSELQLNLGIPLDQKRVSKPFSVTGTIDFKNSSFYFTEGVELEKINGKLKFSGNKIEAERIDAQMYGKPLTMTIYRVEQGKKRTVIAARGGFKAGKLKKAFKHKALDQIKGETDWQMELAFVESGDGGAYLKANSDLKGLTVSLPSPIQKQKHEIQSLNVEYMLSGKEKGKLGIELKNRLKMITRLKLDQDAKGVDSMHLHLGRDGEVFLPDSSNMVITGSSESVDLNRWNSLLQSDDKQDAMDIHIDMERLHLIIEDKEKDTEKSTTERSLAQFPEINVHINQFAYNNTEVGKISIASEKVNGLLEVPQIQVENNHFKIDADGNWSPNGDSNFNWNVDVSDFGGMLSVFDAGSMVTKGNGKIKGSSSWSGSPLDFTLSKLNGNAHLELEDGIIEDVEVGGAGNIIGIFSFKALFKRLFLDFSDVRQKGVEYSLIKGDFKIDHGKAQTENLRLESLPANVVFTGVVGLDSKDFNNVITVVPNVSDTVSGVSLLALGPQTIPVLIFLNKVFEKNIDQKAFIQYKLTGSWDKPQITKVTSEAEATEDAAEPEVELIGGGAIEGEF
jgi:uncharacterized protein (TIGR02099 family)